MVDLKESHRAAFLSFGKQHHDIALFAAPEGAERGKVGLSHIAFQIEGGLPELAELKGRLEEMGASISRTTDHTITKSVYFLDPDGNELEIFAEGFADPNDALDFIKQGTNRQAPLELEGAAAGG